MVFSLFSRKPVLSPPSPPSRSSLPPLTASPSPPPPPPADPTSLHALIAAVPANSLHNYILVHLAPEAPPISHDTLAALTSFFSSLSPPPQLHCARCHKAYFDVENTDRSCLVPHDDDSAEVERVGWARATTAEYETLWACCGRTVEGAGDMGPPDGWCYEGKHTVSTPRPFHVPSAPVLIRPQDRHQARQVSRRLHSSRRQTRPLRSYGLLWTLTATHIQPVEYSTFATWSETCTQSPGGARGLR